MASDTPRHSLSGWSRRTRAKSSISLKRAKGKMPSAPPPDHLVIGVDIGGTGCRRPGTASGEILSHARKPMAGSSSAASSLASVTQAIDTASAQAGSKAGAQNLIRGIGICCPGPLDPNTGVVINPPNLPCWRMPDVD
jgi:predicted NBD/HSP70 family sugar kinase